MTSSKRVKDFAIIFCFACIITIPFINKPVHIDDAAYISFAKMIAKNPLNLFTGKVYWLGKEFLANNCPHPPLFSIFIAFLMKIFGYDAITLFHLCLIIFPITLAISCYLLANNFRINPLHCALLSLATPVSIVLATHIMTDLPYTALWTASITAFIFACTKNNKVIFLLAGVFAALSIFTAYQAVIIIALLFAFHRMEKPPWIGFYLFLLPIIILIGSWIVLSYLYTNSFNIVYAYKSVGNVTTLPLKNRFISASFSIGSCFFFTPCLLYLLTKKTPDIIFYIISILISLFLIPTTLTTCSVNQKIFFVIITSTGICFTFSWFKLLLPKIFSKSVHACPTKPQRKSLLNLNLLWIASILFYNLFIVPFGNPRYLLPILPPVVITTLMLIQKFFPKTIKSTVFTLLLIITTAIWGILIGKADLIWANSYKNFASNFKQKYQNYKGNIYFAGEFGLRYYMEKKGYKYLTRNNQNLKPGDLVIYPAYNGPPLSTYLNKIYKNRLKTIDTFLVNSNYPIRLISHNPKTGFFCSGVGEMCLCFSKSPIEIFHIYQIK